MHTSVPLNQSIELINITPINPLISKCQIKVCYVSDEPNRNNSIINKETGRKLANSIPGSPIVGFYNESKGDFEGHNKMIEIAGGEFKIKDTTRPYGFVDLNAKVWFQKFMDDGVEHEYLMTEGFLWTGQYPECQRVIDKGNNQSMELDENTLNAHWAKNEKGEYQFFIINEAIMSKLCILGEDVEPCFEGAAVTKVQFSFDEELKQSWFSFMNQMKEILNEGGKQPVFNKYDVNIGDALWTALYDYSNEQYTIAGVFEEEGKTFAVLKSQDQDNYYRLDFSFENDVFSPVGELTDMPEFSAENAHFSIQDTLNFKKKEEKKKEEEDGEEKKPFPPKKEEGGEEKKPADDEKKPEDDEDDDSEEDEEKKKKKGKKDKYELTDIPEYVALQEEFNTLQTNYASLEQEVATLREFRAGIEREQKMHMINEDFCMLDEEMKKDVIDNVDKYSLDEIEAKLSIICVRNKVIFNLDDDNKKNPTTFNLDSIDSDDAGVPAWVLAAREVAKTMND